MPAALSEEAACEGAAWEKIDRAMAEEIDRAMAEEIDRAIAKPAVAS